MSKKSSLSICVYAISRDGERGVRRWFESAKDANYLLVVNAHPEFKPLFVAKSLGIVVKEVSIEPWRCDIARNSAIALIPEWIDVCVSLDLNETLSEGWRKEIEESFEKGFNAPLFFEKKTIPENQDQILDELSRVHPRQGFFWQQPFNEQLVALPGMSMKSQSIPVELKSHMDSARWQFNYQASKQLSRLKNDYENCPGDANKLIALMEELFSNQAWQPLIELADAFSVIDSPSKLDFSVACLWLSEAAHNLKLPKVALDWAERATFEAPDFYEAWHWRAHLLHFSEKWGEVLEYASKVNTLKRGSHRHSRESVWSWWGFDLMALALHKLGRDNEALEYGERAHLASPYDPRISRNLMIYRQALLKNDQR